MAHNSISSIPTSSINGKVGLRPGTRAMLGLNPTEVIGGVKDIYATDDREVADAAFITQAKLDLINAYNKAEMTAPDYEKVDLFGGSLLEI